MWFLWRYVSGTRLSCLRLHDICIFNSLFFSLCEQFFFLLVIYLLTYLSFISVLQRVALIVRLCAQIFQIAFVLLISTGPGKIVDDHVVSVQVNILHRNFCQFSQFLAPSLGIIVIIIIIIIIIVIIILSSSLHFARMFKLSA